MKINSKLPEHKRYSNEDTVVVPRKLLEDIGHYLDWHKKETKRLLKQYE